MSRHAVRRCIGVSLLTALFACEERPAPTEPALNALDAPQLVQVRGATRAKVLKRSETLKNDIVATAQITSAGGVLRIDDAGLVVYFPAGAVSENLTVTATAARGKDVIYSFEPHGVTFKAPIVIAQELSATSYARKSAELTPDVQGGYLAAGVRDVDAAGSASLAEAFPAFYGERGGKTYLVFTTSHFSGYIFASGRTESSGSVVVEIPLP